MTRTEAFQVAKSNRAAHSIAQIRFTFDVWATMTDIAAREEAQSQIDAAHGYRHGWYKVGEYSFGQDEITGETYDATQGGWAFL